MLEARVQRLFLAQGIFAERGLIPSAGGGRRLVATDIDVLISDYSTGFNLTLRHAECKSGSRVASLDRAIWMNGVRAMLGANSSHLILESFDEDAADFARSLGVDVMTLNQLAALERDLGIPADDWPNRSAFQLFDPKINSWFRRGKSRSASEGEKAVREAIHFVRTDSWRQFRYALLNQALRTLQVLSGLARISTPDLGCGLSIRYVASAILVRFSQYVLAICHDVSRVPISDIAKYLEDRLSFGDQDPQRLRAVIGNTVMWTEQLLREKGISVPPDLSPDHMFQPPDHAQGLVGLIRELLSLPHEAKYLPISMETEQFGNELGLASFPRLRSAANAGKGLTQLSKAFLVASMGIDSSVIAPVRIELESNARGGPRNGGAIQPPLQESQ